MPFCHNCGNPLRPEAKFCSKCGTKVLVPVEKQNISTLKQIDNSKEVTSVKKEEEVKEVSKKRRRRSKKRSS